MMKIASIIQLPTVKIILYNFNKVTLIAVNSMVGTNIMESATEAAQRFFRKKLLLTQHIIVVIHHQSNHWTLIVSNYMQHMHQGSEVIIYILFAIIVRTMYRISTLREGVMGIYRPWEN